MALNVFFRLLLAFNLGFVLTAFCGLGLIFFVACCVLFLICLLVFVTKKQSFRFLFLLSLAFVLGFGIFLVHDFNFRVRALDFDGADNANVCATVVDVKKNFDDYDEAYVLKIEQINGKKFIWPIYVNVYGNKGLRFAYGDKIEAKMNLVLKQNVNKYIFSSSRAKNIYLNGKILKLVKFRAGEGFFVNFFKVRNSLISAIDFAVKEPANFLASSIFLGQCSGLPYELKRAFNCCGLSHIFAVSGLHISILFAALLCCLNFLKVPNKAVVLILFLFLFCYNVLLGFCVSAIRASLMNFAYFIGVLLKKKLSSVHLLCFAAIIILVFMPGSVYSSTFVLSFSTCFGILIFFKPISFAIKRKLIVFSGWPKLVIDLFSISVSSMVFSSFFIVLFFGKISLLAPFINLLVIPFVPFILIFSGLTAVSGFLGFTTLSCFFGYFCEGIFFELVFLINFFKKFPLCFIPTRYFFVPIVILGLLFFLVFVMLYARNLLFSRVVSVFCSLIVCLPVLNNFVILNDASSVSLIGNSLGFSTVISSSGKVVVINCGGLDCEKHLCDFLDSRGIKRIDFLIFLSSDNSNMGCDLQTIVNCVEVFCVMVPRDVKFEVLAGTFLKQNTNLIFVEQAHFVNFPITIDFVNSNSVKNGFNCHVNLGGLSYIYCLNKLEFLQMQKLRFSNVAIVDDEIEEFDENLNCGFLISTKNSSLNCRNFCSVASNEISDFLIYGSFIKKTSL